MQDVLNEIREIGWVKFTAMSVLSAASLAFLVIAAFIAGDAVGLK